MLTKKLLERARDAPGLAARVELCIMVCRAVSETVSVRNILHSDLHSGNFEVRMCLSQPATL